MTDDQDAKKEVGSRWAIRRAIWRARWASVPALLLVALGIGILALARLQMSPIDLAKEYRKAAAVAFESENWEAADLYFRKLIDLQANDQWANFGLALSAEGMGNQTRARALMRRIAPQEGRGYAPAHFWLAKEMYGDPSGEPPADAQLLESIQKHLLVTVQAQPENLEARTMLGRVCLALVKLDEASLHFAVAAQKDPVLRIPLARLLVSLGKKPEASVQAAAAIEEFSRMVEANERDAEAWLMLAEAQAFMAQYAAAAATYRDGLAATEDPRFHIALANLYAAWFDRSDKAQLGQRLELLQAALTHAPTAPAVLTRLRVVAGRQGKQAEKAREVLEESLTRGDATAMTHLILSTLATEQGDSEKSVLHLKQAYRANPRMESVANNLAWALALNEPPQLERALGLINAALEINPTEPNLRATRGQLLVRMERWEEAVPDLEFAIKSSLKNVLIHKSLASAYDKLGQPELAARHWEFVAPLQAKRDADSERAETNEKKQE